MNTNIQMARRTLRAAATVLATAATLTVVCNPVQAATAAKTVTLTVTIAPTPVEQGRGVLIKGGAANGRTGNTGTVDVYFRAGGTQTYTRHLSLTAAGDGSFTGWDIPSQPFRDREGHVTQVRGVQTSGTYRVVYRGNSARKPATTDAPLHVYTWAPDYNWDTQHLDQTTTYWTKALACLPPAGTTSCSAQSATMTVEPGAVAMRYEQSCYAEGAGKIVVVAFLTTAKNLKPTPRPNEADNLPQWREVSTYLGNQQNMGAGVEPLTLTGHFFIRVPAGCWIGLRAYQGGQHKVSVGTA